MRLPAYARAPRRGQRAFVALTRSLGAELDDVGKVALRRPALFGRPFLALAQTLLRGRSGWTVAERELLAAVVSRANACPFCVGTHGEIAAGDLGPDALARLDAGAFGDGLAATAAFVEELTRDPGAVSAAAVERARAAGVSDAALEEAVQIAFVFGLINRVADALAFEHPSEDARRRGARVLRRLGYRLPPMLLR
jgi:uncharacterized peroxidase-related enzyme